MNFRFFFIKRNTHKSICDRYFEIYKLQFLTNLLRIFCCLRLICALHRETFDLPPYAKGTVYAVGGSTFQHSGSPNVNISGVSEHKSMGYFVVLKMDDLDPVTKRPMYVRF